MNTTTKRTAAVLFAALLGLTACSSGSDDSPSTNSTPTNPSKPANPSNPSTPAAGGNKTALIAPRGDMANAQVTEVSGNYNSNEITINGRKFTVQRPGIISGGFTDISDSTGHSVVSGSKFSYVRFGSNTYFENNGTNVTKAYNSFAIGDITPVNAVPTSGKATYAGDATIGIDSTTFLKGTSSFNVDFGAKTIKGNATNGAFTLPLEGQINGNAFNGTKDGIQMQGNFYGPQAQELGGTYSGQVLDNGSYKSFMGAFGAKKQ